MVDCCNQTKKDNFKDQAEGYKDAMIRLFAELKNATQNIINKEDIWCIFKIPMVKTVFERYFFYYHQRDKDLTDCFTYHMNHFFDDIQNDDAKKDAKILALLSLRCFDYRYALIIWNKQEKMAYLNDPIQIEVNNFPWFNIVSTNTIIFDFRKTMELIQRYNSKKNDISISINDSIDFWEETSDPQIEVHYDHRYLHKSLSHISLERNNTQNENKENALNIQLNSFSTETKGINTNQETSAQESFKENLRNINPVQYNANINTTEKTIKTQPIPQQNSIASFIKNIPKPLKIGIFLITGCCFLLYIFKKMQQNYTFIY
ncbi:MAG TPA: hypothetical protein VL201_03890 [Patescibacteria group bacterium]|jgi:hypothetical protein|nr:hypothetical protein [Patescibacteria group bacterium]